MAPFNQYIVRGILGAAFLLVLVKAEMYELGISHCNDINGQMEAFEKGTNNSSKAPTPCKNPEGENCIGGLANLVHWLHAEKGDGFNFSPLPDLNRLRLSSGNLIGGESGWIPAVETGWSDYASLIKTHIDPKFTALGMKEFGAGLRQTVDFVKGIGNSTTGVPNTCETSNEGAPEKEFCALFEKKYLKVSLQPNRGTTSPNGNAILADYDIGIVGFVTPNVERLSLPGELKFSNISEYIKKITENAAKDDDVKTFIAIGDGNLETSKEIIDKAPNVKLVIYGAGLSNTNINEYPLKHKDSYIVTAGRYGSTVGKLHLEIDGDTDKVTLKSGKLIETETPDSLTGEASKAKDAVDKWGEEITKQKGEPIGNSRYNLTGGETCWRKECEIGNLMTDAVVHCVLNRFDITKPFPHLLHSIWHGGAFFEDTINGTISEFDVHKLLPYHNNVHLVKVEGSNLRKIFEASATGIEPGKFGDKDWRQFLQVSNGLEVFYDTQSDSPKVTSIEIVHDDNGVPEFVELDDTKEYHLAIPTYLYEGRGVYDFAKDFWMPSEEIPPSESGTKNVFDDECLEGYIRAMKHISVGLEERIWVNEGNGEGGSTEAPGTTTTTNPTTSTTTNPTTTTGGPGTSGGTTQEPCPTPPEGSTPAPCPKHQKTAVTVTLTILFYTITLAIGYVGYFYVLPRLRRPPLSEQYPPNQL